MVSTLSPFTGASAHGVLQERKNGMVPAALPVVAQSVGIHSPCGAAWCVRRMPPTAWCLEVDPDPQGHHHREQREGLPRSPPTPPREEKGGVGSEPSSYLIFFF